MNPLIFLLIWLVPCIIVCIFVGAYIGYSFALRHHSKVINEERAKTLDALQHVVASADELSFDVDQHNTDLRTVGREVSDLTGDGEYEVVKQTLLNQITGVIESNRKLEHDLVCTKYHLEEQAQELDSARLEARTDELSRLGNRKAFNEALQFMYAQMQRNRVEFALLLIDVDHFKWINDTHGHQSGDMVVQRIGETLKAITRNKDHVARYGGDEFAILFQNTSLDGAIELTNKLRQKVERTNFDVGVRDSRVAVTMSMGLVMAHRHDDPESILQKADAALYRSKESGRNRLTIFNDANAAMLLENCPRKLQLKEDMGDEDESILVAETTI